MSSANRSVPATAPESVSISTDRERLDVPWIVRSIRGSYWGGAYPDGQVRQALNGSLVFGAYLSHTADGYSLVELLRHAAIEGAKPLGAGRQIGFVRVVTDGSIFSSITDVFVDEAHRGKGVGSSIMQAVVEHPSVAGTYSILRARPASYLWYFKFDYHLFDAKHGLMQRMPK